MPRIGIRELKNKLSLYLRRAAEGEWIEVTKRGKAVALIVPVGADQGDRLLLSLVNEGVASWSGGKPQGASPPVRGHGQSLAQIVLDDRR